MVNKEPNLTLSVDQVVEEWRSKISFYLLPNQAKRRKKDRKVVYIKNPDIRVREVKFDKSDHESQIAKALMGYPH